MRAALLLLAALASVGCGGDAPAATPLTSGARLETALTLATEAAPDRPVAVASLLGKKATVFYAWSVLCPCVEAVEARIQKLMKASDPEVSWLAVDGEPRDTLEQIREKRLRLGAPYRILLDPRQQLCRMLEFDSAVQVAVLDADGRLAYRGALDGDYVDGKGEYLADALEAVLAGTSVSVPERPRTYGCFFDDPASCTETR